MDLPLSSLLVALFDLLLLPSLAELATAINLLLLLLLPLPLPLLFPAQEASDLDRPRLVPRRREGQPCRRHERREGHGGLLRDGGGDANADGGA